MESSVLEMEFLDSAGKKFRITIDNPRTDLTEAEVRTVMDDIVAKDIFFSTSGDIVSVSGANIVTTTVQELEI